MKKIIDIIEKIKKPTDFNEFKTKINELVDYYLDIGPRHIVTCDTIGNRKSVHDKDTILSDEEYAAIFDPESEKKDMRPKFKISSVTFDFSYYKNKKAIEKIVNLVGSGKTLYMVLFNLDCNEIICIIIDYSDKTYWEIKFNAGSYEECVLVRDLFLEARSRRRKNLFSHLIGTSEVSETLFDIIDKSIIDNKKVVYERYNSAHIINYEYIDDWLHYNQVDNLIHYFHLKDLTRIEGSEIVPHQIVELRLDKEKKKFHIVTFFVIHDGSFFIQEIVLPFVSNDDVTMLERIIINIDRLNDTTIFKILTKDTSLGFLPFNRE